MCRCIYQYYSNARELNMYDNDDYKVHINITKLEDLNKDEEYKIELEWWIEFSKEFAFE